MPKTEDIRSAYIKQQLRDTMRRVVSFRDFEVITVNQLCIDAAVSRTTFYQHYEDKYDLMVDCIRELVLSPVGLLTNENPEPFFRQVVHTLKDNEAMIGRLEKISGTMELKRKMDNMFVDIFTEYFNQKYPDGVNPDGIPVYMLAAYHCHGVMQMIITWRRESHSCSEEAFIRFLSRQIEEA